MEGPKRERFVGDYGKAGSYPNGTQFAYASGD